MAQQSMAYPGRPGQTKQLQGEMLNRALLCLWNFNAAPALHGQNAVTQLPGNLHMRQENIYPWLHIHCGRTHIPSAFIPSHTGPQGPQKDGHAYDPQATLAPIVDVANAVQVAPC